MDMQKWVAGLIAAEKKKPLPVVSFPAIQVMGISVKDLIEDAGLQAEAMKIVADRLDTSASVSFMDLSVEAEAFGSEIRVSDEEVPTVVGSIVDEDSDPDDLVVPEVGAGPHGPLRRGHPAASCRSSMDRPVLAGVYRPLLFGRSPHGRERDHAPVLRGARTRVTRCSIRPPISSSAYTKAFKEAGADGVVVAEPMAGLLSAGSYGRILHPLRDAASSTRCKMRRSLWSTTTAERPS